MHTDEGLVIHTPPEGILKYVTHGNDLPQKARVIEKDRFPWVSDLVSKTNA